MTESDVPPTGERKRLAERAVILSDRVGALSTAVDQLDQRTNRGERVVVGVVLGLVLDLILSAIVGVLLFQLDNTNAREEQTRRESLCPFYQLILGTYNPASRAEGPARDQYIHQFVIMRGAYDALDCAGPLVPPAAPR